MSQTQTRLEVGTKVAINIAQGMNTAVGVIEKSQMDDGNWLYKVNLVGNHSASIDVHRNEDGELWVWDFEVEPLFN